MLLCDALEEGKVAKNVARSKKIKVLKSAPSTRRPITLDELERILDVASVEWYGIALLGFYPGQRLRDLAGLRWSDVDLVGGASTWSPQRLNARRVSRCVGSCGGILRV
jgi:integrase